MWTIPTTTRPRRSDFRPLRAFLESRIGKSQFEVLDVGPGLAVKYIGRLCAEDVPGWEIFRRAETAIRRLPLPERWFESYEPGEILEALDGLPVHMTVIDIVPLVVRTVARSYPAVDAMMGDLKTFAPGRQFDAVVARHMLGRIGEGRAYAESNLRRLVAPDGFLFV
jgi:hypothetical protein